MRIPPVRGLSRVQKRSRLQDVVGKEAKGVRPSDFESHELLFRRVGDLIELAEFVEGHFRRKTSRRGGDPILTRSTQEEWCVGIRYFERIHGVAVAYLRYSYSFLRARALPRIHRYLRQTRLPVCARRRLHFADPNITLELSCRSSSTALDPPHVHTCFKSMASVIVASRENETFRIVYCLLCLMGVLCRHAGGIQATMRAEAGSGSGKR